MSNHKSYNIQPKETETRNCIEPWHKAFIRANGDVHLCCNNSLIGNIKDEPFEQLINNHKAKAYRQGLLDGKLMPSCVKCPDKGVISQSKLRELVIIYLEKNEIHAS